MESRRIIFYLPEKPNLLNLSGPLHVFQEANDIGGRYSFAFISQSWSISNFSGLNISNIVPYQESQIRPGDMLVLCGLDDDYRDNHKFHNWLARVYNQNCTMVSICVSAFYLGHAGILDGAKCTTHWKYVQQLADEFPNATVLRDEIFVKQPRMYTSAGVASGIDLALSIVEDDLGSMAALNVAKELVLFIRRDGTHTQKSIFLDYRNHINSGIHKAQDYLIANTGKKVKLEELADVAAMSVRNLTRSFKKSTGATINEYSTMLRVDRAKKLLSNSELSVEAVSAQCGFDDPTQLRRIWKKTFNVVPSRHGQRLQIRNKKN